MEKRTGGRRERDGECYKKMRRFCFCGGFLTSSVKGQIWRVVVVFLGETFLEKLEDLHDRKPELRVDVLMVLDVIDVFVSVSSV